MSTVPHKFAANILWLPLHSCKNFFASCLEKLPMLYTKMILPLVAYSSLHRVTIQDSSLLSSGHSDFRSVKNSATSPVWFSRLTSLATRSG